LCILAPGTHQNNGGEGEKDIKVKMIFGEKKGRG
jgi:hypothetical protein